MNDTIVVEDVRKQFGEVVALDGVSFAVEAGSVLGLLGPNGAGKTTAVRILTTILPLEQGHASVLGIDVAKNPQSVRLRIGLAGQYAAVDEVLTGRENLRLAGRLCHLPRSEAEAPRGGAARPLRTERCRRPVVEDVLGRHAAPARPRRGPRAQAADPVPRRAHHRSRPGFPTRPVGDHRRPRRRRHDRAAHHAVPRGGRPARRQHRGHRPRSRHRRGHRDRAQGRTRLHAHRGERPAHRDRTGADRRSPRSGPRPRPTPPTVLRSRCPTAAAR